MPDGDNMKEILEEAARVVDELNDESVTELPLVIRFWWSTDGETVNIAFGPFDLWSSADDERGDGESLIHYVKAEFVCLVETMDSIRDDWGMGCY